MAVNAIAAGNRFDLVHRQNCWPLGLQIAPLSKFATRLLQPDFSVTMHPIQ
jgi:hypothetical protein